MNMVKTVHIAIGLVVMGLCAWVLYLLGTNYSLVPNWIIGIVVLSAVIAAIAGVTLLILVVTGRSVKKVS